ncbi:MAG: hypothetical protein GXY86_16805 [Firmicutes bacterium]|nr:hypothetical protein [Bacillota bacterium]
MKKPILFKLIVFVWLLFKPINGYATIAPVKPDYEKNYSEFKSIQLNNPGSVLLKGEIVGINHGEILINPLTDNSNDFFRLKLIRETKLYCNGTVSEWAALTPVAPEAYFEAQVLMNRETEAIAVNAFYYGEECIVNRSYQNQGQLFLELISAHSGETFVSPLTKEARLPLNEGWMQTGQAVYVLFSDKNSIRGVYIPD